MEPEEENENLRENMGMGYGVRTQARGSPPELS